MDKTAPTTDEFATAMQQLSAEAEKSIPPGSIPPKVKPSSSENSSAQLAGVRALDSRLKTLEAAIAKKIEDLVEGLNERKDHDLRVRFQKIDDQLSAIRNTESVNQRLFDSLHEELLKYRDNFLHESLQKPFIHDLVHLFDDLNSLADQLRNSAEQKNRAYVGQWRDNLDNAVHSLIEILHRFDVKEIEAKETVDRTLHRVVSYEPANFPEEDGRIVMRVKRGFFWRDQLIRPEEVIAKRFS